VITEAGNDPKVAKLVYIAAFAPDKGESVASLIKDPPPGAPVPPILPPQDGFLFLDNAKFAESFAADVEPGKAQFMADSQVPWGVAALEGAVSEPAWKKKPSWYLVATDDRMIPPAAQRFMSKRAGAKVDESAGSHAIYVSRPRRSPLSSEKQLKPDNERQPPVTRAKAAELQISAHGRISSETIRPPSISKIWSRLIGLPGKSPETLPVTTFPSRVDTLSGSTTR
jgi:hypothetical protein